MKQPTAKEVEEIRWTIKQTQVTDRLRTSINNLYRQFINPTAERCSSNGCGKLKKYQDELNRWYSTQNHKWDCIKEEKTSLLNEFNESKASLANGVSAIENALSQVNDYKINHNDLLDMVKAIYPKKVISIVEIEGLVYVNNKKQADYQVVDGKLNPLK